MNEKKRNEARERLMRVLPHLSVAVAQAKVEAPGSKPIFAVGYENPDGSGRINARLDVGSFVEDLVAVLGFETIYELDAQLPEEGL